MFNPEMGGYSPKKENESSKIDETREGESISPERIKSGIWDAYQSIKNMTYLESAKMIMENDRNKSFVEPDYSDSVKDFAFRQIRPAADYLTEEQRQDRRRIIEAELERLKRLAESKKNLPKDKQMEIDRELPQWKLKKEFWNKELEIFDKIDGKNKQLGEELSSFEQACLVVPDGPAKQLLAQRRDELKKSLESKTSPKTSNDLDGMLEHEGYIKECYHPIGIRGHNMGIRCILKR